MNVFPEYFAYDIQANDTDIFPLLTIGSSYDWRGYIPEDHSYLSPVLDTFFNPITLPWREFLLLSTTNLRAILWDSAGAETFAGSLNLYDFAPIISNISNLKESLDIEKGKHKISSFTVTLINAPYNGLRFSDVVGELESLKTPESEYSGSFGKTIVGMDIQLHWASQSTIAVNSPSKSGNAYKVFSGIITKYEHSKKTVKLTIEDETSQRIVGKKFPKHNIGDGDDVPALYRNKPYPVVYGEVDNSPCLVKTQAGDTGGSPVPTVYCDRSMDFDPEEGASYSSFNSKVTGLYTPDGAHNPTCLSFFDEDEYSYVLEHFIENSPETLQGSGASGEFPVLYKPLEGGIYRQYTDHAVPFMANKVFFNNLPRNPNFFNNLVDDGLELPEDGPVVASQTNVTDDIAYCYSILTPLSARLYQEENDFSLSNFPVATSQVDYHAQHYTDNNKVDEDGDPAPEEIFLYQTGDLTTILGDRGLYGNPEGQWIVEGRVNAYFPADNFPEVIKKNHIRIGFTMSKLPSDLAPLPFHLSFIGNINYTAESIYQDEWESQYPGSPYYIGSGLDTSGYKHNGIYASIIFGAEFGTPLGGLFTNTPGYISLTPPEITNESLYCAYPCVGHPSADSYDGFEIGEIDGWTWNDLFSETLTTMYDPVVSFDASNRYFWNPSQDVPDNTGGYNDQQGNAGRSIFSARIKRFAFFAQFYVTNFSEKQLYGHVIGRRWDADGDGVFEGDGTYPSVPGMINDLLRNELWEGPEYPWNDQSQVTYGNDEEYALWKYGVTVHKEMEGQKFIEELLSVSPYMMKFNTSQNSINYPVIKSAYSGEEIAGAFILDNDDIIDFSFSRTKLDDVYSKIIFKYKWDYGREVYLKEYSFDHTEASQLNDYGDKYNPEFYGKKFGERVLLIGEDDERGKYIRDPDTAENFVKWKFYQQCNQHLKIKVKLPLKYMNFETGDLIKFSEQIGDINPYGIQYNANANFSYIIGSNMSSAPGDEINGQQAYPLFMINSLSKGLKFIEMECTQLHNLADGDYSRNDSVFGCMNTAAWNYDPNATDEPNVVGGGCIYPGDFIVPMGDFGCPLETGDLVGFPDEYSTNYAGGGPNEEYYFTDMGPDDGVFTFEDEAEFINLTNVPNGAAYEWWMNSGQADDYTNISGPRLYSYGNCIFGPIVQHDLDKVKLIAKHNDPPSYNEDPGGTSYQTNFGGGFFTFLEWNVHEHELSEEALTDPTEIRYYIVSYLKADYLDENNMATLKFNFTFNVHDWPSIPDATFAGDNHLNIEIKSEDYSATLYSFDMYDFSINNGHREWTNQPGGIRHYDIETPEFLFDFSEYVIGAEAAADDEIFQFKFHVVYTLNVQTTPVSTEIMRWEELTESVNSPLHAIYESPALEEEEDCAIAWPMADLNMTGTSDIGDLVIMIFDWVLGEAHDDPSVWPDECFMFRSELTGDGVVNILECIIMISTILNYNWLDCYGDDGLQRVYDWSIGGYDDPETALANPCSDPDE